MNQRDARDLLELVDQFIDGRERSKQLAAEIEGIVVECCQDQGWFDDASEALALFVPGGGGHYLDESELAAELVPVADVLREILEEASRCSAEADGESVPCVWPCDLGLEDSRSHGCRDL